MTKRSFDLSSLEPIEPVARRFYEGEDRYMSYLPGEDLVPPFLPVGNDRHQVRLNSSTHDQLGILQNRSAEALANTRRLPEKIERNIGEFTFYELDEQEEAGALIVSYGATAQAAREAVVLLRSRGSKVSLLVVKTLLPIPSVCLSILERYARIIIAEENLGGTLRQLLFGQTGRRGVSGVNAIGKSIPPEEIAAEVSRG